MDEELKNTINSVKNEADSAISTAQNTSARKKTGKVAGKIKAMLEGTFLVKSTILDFLPFIFFLTFLSATYIYNNHHANSAIININNLKKQNAEYRYDYIITRSLLTQFTTQTKIAKQLEKKGLKETKDPVRKIQVESPKQKH